MTGNGQNTKEQIVHLGRDLVQRMGYHSFRYQLIAKELDIKNAAIHHYFPGKEDLGVAIIQKDLADFQDMTRMVEKESPTAKAELLLTSYKGFLRTGKGLCVIGSCASAYSEIPERMKAAASDYCGRLNMWLTDVFREGQQTGEFGFTGRPEEMTALWTATLPGALQVAQMQGEAWFDNVMLQLKKALKG
jgi:TetR/AcrR family transcriptional repressor of nem operon